MLKHLLMFYRNRHESRFFFPSPVLSLNMQTLKFILVTMIRLRILVVETVRGFFIWILLKSSASFGTSLICLLTSFKGLIFFKKRVSGLQAPQTWSHILFICTSPWHSVKQPDVQEMLLRNQSIKSNKATFQHLDGQPSSDIYIDALYKPKTRGILCFYSSAWWFSSIIMWPSGISCLDSNPTILCYLCALEQVSPIWVYSLICKMMILDYLYLLHLFVVMIR